MPMTLLNSVNLFRSARTTMCPTWPARANQTSFPPITSCSLFSLVLIVTISKTDQGKRGVYSALVYCWASVADAGPTVNQHWVNASRSLGDEWSILILRIVTSDPGNPDTTRWPNVESKLAHRQRRWPNIKPTLGQSLVLTGIVTSNNLGLIDKRWLTLWAPSSFLCLKWMNEWGFMPYI